jgi:hypothetical protein
LRSGGKYLKGRGVSMTSKRPRLSRGDLTIRVAGVVALIGIAINIALSNPHVDNTLALATTHQPETFTELYFNNSWSLPKTVTAGVPASFSYHVTNYEAKDNLYEAQATLVEDGASTTIARGRFLLTNGEGKDVSVTFTPTAPNQQLELIVALPAQKESIHFWSQS